MKSSTACPALTSSITRRGDASIPPLFDGVRANNCAPAALPLMKSSTFDTVRLNTPP
jgi:hypothetical protein